MLGVNPYIVVSLSLVKFINKIEKALIPWSSHHPATGRRHLYGISSAGMEGID
jgi:hypothetical protein